MLTQSPLAVNQWVQPIKSGFLDISRFIDIYLNVEVYPITLIDIRMKDVDTVDEDHPRKEKRFLDETIVGSQ